jgi:pyoverdine/dityrosine biosynthesis protein Dit1
MSNPSAGQRAAIRNSCQSLRRLLYFVRPVGATAIVEEVGNIECDALAANDDELPAVTESLERLIGRLKETRAGDIKAIINPERWKQFVGEI